MARGAWWATVSGIPKSWIWLSNWACRHTRHLGKHVITFLKSEENMRGLHEAWRQKTDVIVQIRAGSQVTWLFSVLYFLIWVSLVAQLVKNLLQCGRPGFDPWVGKIHWRRAWQPTPVFLPGEFHGQRSLAGCSPWGRQESNTTKHSTAQHSCIVQRPLLNTL